MTSAVPIPTAVTGMEMLFCPAEKEMGLVTVATCVFELETMTFPDEIGVGESLAVNTPVPPRFTVNGLGVSSGMGVGTRRVTRVV